VARELEEFLRSLADLPEMQKRRLATTPECPDMETFALFMERQLPRKDMKRVQRHLAGCYPCLLSSIRLRPYVPENAWQRHRRRKWLLW